jgi:hypothetical protein
LETLPQQAIILDDWLHGYGIMRDYFQGVLGVRPDITVYGWYPADVIGRDPAAQDRMLIFIEHNFGLAFPDAGYGHGLDRVANYVQAQVRAGRPVYVATTEYSLSALLDRLQGAGLEIRPEGEFYRVVLARENGD